MTKILSFIGSPYTGSTLITEYLSKVNGIMSIGEAQRYYRFKQFEHAPEHYLEHCSYCSTQQDPNCPVWHDSYINKEGRGLYEEIVGNTPAEVVIDSSKEVDWFRDFVHPINLPLYCVLLVRNPIGFVSSNLKRRPEMPIFNHAEGWRNIYEHSLKVLSSMSCPILIIRYEDFLTDPFLVTKNILHFVGMEVPQVSFDNESASHPLGGNIIHLASSSRFDVNTFKQSKSLGLVNDDFGVQVVASGGSGTNEIGKRRITNLSQTDVHTIIDVPYLLQMASLLGYYSEDLYNHLQSE